MEKMSILGLGRKLVPGVDYRGAGDAHTSLNLRWPWMLGQRNLILEQSVDRNKCIVGFKSFGVLGSNLGLCLQAVGVGLWTCHLTFGSLHFFIYTLRIILSGVVRIKGATKKLFAQGLIHIQSVQFSRSVVSDSLRPHESQHTRPPCPSPTPGVHSNSCPSSP